MAGFSHAGVPELDTKLIGLVASELPAIIIILIVEHIAIAKSFGRIFGYTVVPSQEMIAQGASNILSPFVGGYVCTGSFGASAVLSKAAVRTPLAGLFSAMVLILALYALTGVFFYIPNAALAGLIIHCTCNLITKPQSLLKYWRFSPFEFFIWVCGVIIAFFTDLEIAIYVTVGLSFAMLLVRMARNPGKFRGAVSVTRVVRNDPSREVPASCSSSARTLQIHNQENRNSDVKVEPAYPGVFIYRFAENFNYINQAHHIDHLTTYIISQTRPTDADDAIRTADRLWCEQPPSKKLMEEKCDLPILKAVVLDFSTVNIIDLTSLQGLIELRSSLDRYAAPALVEWHFAGVHNSWTRRALAYAGFGLPAGNSLDALGNWCPVYTVVTSLSGATEDEEHDLEISRRELQMHDEESRLAATQRNNSKALVEDKYSINSAASGPRSSSMPIYGIDRPLFHIDLHDAVDGAVRDAKRQDSRGKRQHSASESGETTAFASKDESGGQIPV
jgi:sodium-independent sulfate anion transporter 11